VKYAVVLSLSHASFSLGAQDPLSHHAPSSLPLISDGELRAFVLDTVSLNYAAPIRRLTKASGICSYRRPPGSGTRTVKVEQSGYQQRLIYGGGELLLVKREKAPFLRSLAWDQKSKDGGGGPAGR
jgi:hypothetical protein